VFKFDVLVKGKYVLVLAQNVWFSFKRSFHSLVYAYFVNYHIW